MSPFRPSFPKYPFPKIKCCPTICFCCTFFLSHFKVIYSLALDFVFKLLFKLVYSLLLRCIMPAKRKMFTTPRSYSKRARSGTKRSLKKNNASGDIPRGILNKFSSVYTKPDTIHRLILRQDGPVFGGGTTTGSGYSFNVALNGLANYSAYTTVFDSYRIVAIELHFVPNFDQVPLSANLQGKMLSAFDFDDSVVPASGDAVRAYQSCVVTAPGKHCKRSFIPKVADALYSGAFTSFGSTSGNWIDCASPGVIHYGLKVWIEPSTAIQSSWSCEYKCFVEFKSIHAT